MISRESVAAVIPAYREAQFIGDVVTRTRAVLDSVFVVDDGSPDETAAEAVKAGAQLLRHEVNQGKGAAIQTGFRAILEQGFEYVILLDGDGQHLPEEISRFLRAGRDFPVPMILGNRMSDMREMPFVRRATNQSMSWIIGKVCRQTIPDTQCGFRMIRRDLIPHLFLPSRNYDYETEMILIAAQLGFQIESVPVSTVYGDEKSKIHPVRDTIRFFKLISRYI